MTKPAKNTVCLWYDGAAVEAARFYVETSPDSSVGAGHRAPKDRKFYRCLAGGRVEKAPVVPFLGGH